jgi:hypothetical protein
MPMNNLLAKEFKLSVHVTSYLFLLLSPMLLIPNYPYYVVFFYQTLGIFFMFMNGNITNDVFFTALLPVRKRDAVKARLVTVVIFELLQIAVSVPFAFLRSALIPMQNAAGIEANAALFGLVLVMFGIFNLVFLPQFYQTAYKTGTPYLFACTAMVVFVIAAEAAINLIPTLKSTLDTTNPAFLVPQLIVLAGGVVLFVGLSILAYSQSAKRFEQLDL